MAKDSMELEFVKFDDCALYDNKLLFVTNKDNVLVELNLEDGRMCFNKFGMLDFRADGVLCAKDKFYALELDGHRLAEIDIKSSQCNYINIECQLMSWNNYILFTEYQEKIYIFPRNKPEIVIVDLRTRDVKKRDLSSLGYSMDYENKSGCRIGEDIYILQNSGKNIFHYSLYTEETDIIQVFEGLKTKAYIMGYERYLYSISEQNQLFRIDLQNGGIEILWKFECNEKIVRFVVTDVNIWILPSFGIRLFLYDFRQKRAEEFTDYPIDYYYNGPEEWGKFFGYAEDQKMYCLAMRSANYILTINKSAGIHHFIKPTGIDASEFVSLIKKNNKKLFLEPNYYLSEFLQIADYSEPSENQPKTHIGDKIYRYLTD